MTKKKEEKIEKEEQKITKTEKIYFFPEKNKTIKAASLEEAKSKLK